MAIRKVVTRSMAYNAVTTGKIVDGTIATADLANNAVTGAKATGVGGGYFQGENGVSGDASSGKADIFRVNESTLNTSVTIASGDNASCAGPLTVSTSGTVNLTVNGNLTIV